MKPSWYSITAKSPAEYEIAVYGEIGVDVTDQSFITAFQKIPSNAKVTLRISSVGGDVFSSLAIHSVISRHQGIVEAFVDGLAASAASVIAMAAKTLTMPENSFLMIHNSSALGLGDAKDFSQLAAVLDKIDDSLISIYCAKSGQSREKIAELMAAETWLTGVEAKALGLCDKVIPAMKIAARGDLQRFTNLPQQLQEIKTDAPTPEPTIAPAPADPVAVAAATNEQLIRDLCVTFGLPTTAAAVYIAEGLNAKQALDRLHQMDKEIEKQQAEPANVKALAKQKTRMLDIFQACVDGGRPELAKQLITSDMDVEAVKAKLSDPLQFNQLQIAYDTGEIRAIYALCVGAGVEDLASEFIAKGTPLAEVRDRLKHADAIRCRCFAAASLLGKQNTEKRARNYILAGATPEEVSYSLCELLAAAEPQIDNSIPMAVLTGQRTQKPITDISTTIWKNRRAQLVKLQGGRIG